MSNISKAIKSLHVHGQGVILFHNSNSTHKCVIYCMNKKQSDGLQFHFTDTTVKVIRVANNVEYIDEKNREGLTRKHGATYWISLDSQNQLIQAGVGEARIETCIYRYKWKSDTTNHPVKHFLETLHTIHPSEESVHLNILSVLKDPITNKLPLLVKNTDELTMSSIAKCDYLPKAFLSPTSQRLYDCISGKKFILNGKDFPNFSDAIKHSILTPGLWCNTRLKEKATEFNKDKPNFEETYLRITLTQNNGESPGIPYVMEIWPSGHYSPIHSHAGGDAIIRVLHGSIQVSLYPFLCDTKTGIEPFAITSFKQNQITWISPTLNQTHKLLNITNEPCITIQCYMYEKDDTQHYDYFDYIDAKGQKLQYEPDSDMDFLKFKELMKKEYTEQRSRGWSSKLNPFMCLK